MCFELNRCKVTWSYVKSVSDLLDKQTQVMLLSLIFFYLWFTRSCTIINVYGWHCNASSGHFHCVQFRLLLSSVFFSWKLVGYFSVTTEWQHWLPLCCYGKVLNFMIKKH